MTKTLILAATFACSVCLPAFAGGLSEPVMEADIIIEDTTASSSGSSTLPLIIFAMLVAAATSN